MNVHSDTSKLNLSDISEKDKPWDTHRANASAVQLLYQGSDFHDYSIRIQQCSQLLGFALEAQEPDEWKLKLRQAKFCRVRHCPVCQWRRTLVWRARFFTAIPKVMEAYPKHRWVFLTLTICNCPLTELKTTLQEMNRAWKRLTLKKQFPAVGFIRSTEVTRAKNGDAHPHFHILMLVPNSYFGRNYINQAEWRELWKLALRVDYLPVVNVKAVKSAPGRDPAEGIRIAVLETAKYGVKESDLMHDQDWLIEMTKQMHKTRAINLGGVIKDFLSEEEPDDLIHLEEEKETLDSTVDMWFGWREMVKRYVKSERC